jgi:hypothetical protein
VQRHGALYAEEYGWNEEFEGLVAGIVGKFVEHLDPAKRKVQRLAELDHDRRRGLGQARTRRRRREQDLGVGHGDGRGAEEKSADCHGSKQTNELSACHGW